MATAQPPARRFLPATKRERYLENELEAVHTILDRIALNHENMQFDGEPLSEKLADIEMMLDAKGWISVFEYDENQGLTLGQLKKASAQIRELMIGNPFMRRGSQLRNAGIWGGGVEFACRNRTGKQTFRPLPVDIQGMMESPSANRYIFGNDAHEEMERTAFSDGIFFSLGHDITKRLQRISLHEITADLRNPDNPEEIWAYRRTWRQNPVGETAAEQREITRWYYTDIYDGRRQQTITYMGKRERVEPGYTMLDKGFNQQVGWAYGAPDALCVVAWSKLYKEFLTNGYIMSRALARFAYKVTVGSTAGAARASAEMTAPGQAGSSAIEGLGNSLQPMMTAGRGYDFESGRPLAAAMAAGLEVSLLALLGDSSGSAGNAAETSLDRPRRDMAYMRRKSWDDYFARLFRWMGLSQRLVCTWHDLPDETLQRQLQALTLADQLEVFGPEVMQKQAATVLNISNPGEIPEGWKTKSQRGGPKPTTAGNAGATAGTGQGDDDDSGQTDLDHDDDAE